MLPLPREKGRDNADQRDSFVGAVAGADAGTGMGFGFVLRDGEVEGGTVGGRTKVEAVCNLNGRIPAAFPLVDGGI